MNNQKIEIEVARLDGFLSGIATLNGEIRDYSAFSRLLKLDEEVSSVEESLKKFFNWIPSLKFSEIRHLTQGLRDLEVEIRIFLVRDVAHISSERLSDIQRYLSFRVMDVIDGVVGNAKDIEVLKMTVDSDNSSSECVFFCVRIKKVVIFLQFNNDIKFKEARSKELGLG